MKPQTRIKGHTLTGKFHSWITFHQRLFSYCKSNKYIVKIEVQPTYNGFKTVHIAIKLHLWRIYWCRLIIWMQEDLWAELKCIWMYRSSTPPTDSHHFNINLLSVLKLFLKLSTRNQCHFLRMWRQIFPHGNVVTNKSWKTNLTTVQIQSCWTDGGNWIK